MAQYNFAADWEHFFDGMATRITNRQIIEREYLTILRKAGSVECDNSTDAACYYFMAAILCYLFYDHPDNTDNHVENWAVEKGEAAIKNASRLLPDDEEFKVLTLVFEMLGFLKLIHESSISPGLLFQRLQSIKQECPPIESSENTLIKNEVLRDWFNSAYYGTLYVMLDGEKLEDNLELKKAYASELKNSSGTYDQIVAFAYLAESLFNLGKYSEAQRYAILGKDVLGCLSKYDNDNDSHYYWGVCWSIYAKCQMEAGDMEFAMGLIEKGASLGIPLCEKELEQIEQNVKSLWLYTLDGDRILHEQIRKEYASRIKRPFIMEIEDVWELENYHKIPLVGGRIWSGEIKKGDIVVIECDTKKTEATVFGVVMFEKVLDKAKAGDACGILLPGVDIEDIQLDSKIYKLSE